MTDSQKVEPIRRRLHCVTASDGGRPKTLSLTSRLALRIDPLLAGIRSRSTVNAPAARLRRP
jgi:hypothetical protein